jgi:hypothetical protein
LTNAAALEKKRLAEEESRTAKERRRDNQLVQVSDIRVTDLDALLRIWVSQLLENAIERRARFVEVHLYERGVQGFDVVDDGEAIPARDFDNPDYARCMESR